MINGTDYTQIHTHFMTCWERVIILELNLKAKVHEKAESETYSEM